LRWSPAFVAAISGSTIDRGSTRRNRIPNRFRNESRTPEANAVIHSPIGMNRATTMKSSAAEDDDDQGTSEDDFFHD
jgi:hypothetical protein